MNIFILDEDINKNVQYYCDEHSYKMQLEYAQILCTNYWIDTILGYKPRKLNEQELQILKVGAGQIRKSENSDLYFPTHINHPSVIWARTSLCNTFYLFSLVMVLHKEWHWRYGHPETKFHKAAAIAARTPMPRKIKAIDRTPFVLTMPDKYKDKDVVTAYRNYYRGEKNHLHWNKKREKPDWMKG